MEPSRNRPEIRLRFNRQGGKTFGELTKSNLQNALTIVVAGRVVAAPIVLSEIRDQVVITGAFTEAEAQDLVTKIKAPQAAKPADPAKAPPQQPSPAKPQSAGAKATKAKL